MFVFSVLTIICLLFHVAAKASNSSTGRIHKHRALLYTVEFSKYEPQKENFYLPTSQMTELATVYYSKGGGGESLGNLERYLSDIL